MTSHAASCSGTQASWGGVSSVTQGSKRAEGCKVGAPVPHPHTGCLDAAVPFRPSRTSSVQMCTRSGQSSVSGSCGSFQSWKALLSLRPSRPGLLLRLLLTRHTHCPLLGAGGVSPSWLGYTPPPCPTVKTETHTRHFHVLTPPAAESSKFRNKARDRLAVPRCSWPPGGCSCHASQESPPHSSR